MFGYIFFSVCYDLIAVVVAFAVAVVVVLLLVVVNKNKQQRAMNVCCLRSIVISVTGLIPKVMILLITALL